MAVIIDKKAGDDGVIQVMANKKRYVAKRDGKTGDWMVRSHDDEMVQGDWMRTEDDAVKYILERAGVLSDAKYQRAPERC